MSESSENSRRDFLKKGALGVTLAAWGQLVFSCSSSGEGHEHGMAEQTDTVKVLTPDGQLVEVNRAHLMHAHHTQEVSYEEARTGVPGKKFVMVIDLARCTNARRCVSACQKMHHLPPDREWLTVKLMKDSKTSEPYWFPKTCFHCDNPPCVKVCPVDATFKRQDGLVLVDNTRCIGCKFCMTACPYSTRVFNWGEPGEPADMKTHYSSPETSIPGQVGTVEKCDFCPDMARMGKLPDCVTACPNGAFFFGDQNEDIVTNGSETFRFSELIAERAAYRYGEELGTEPRVYYLPPVDRIRPAEEALEEMPEERRKLYEDQL
ncbi:MAG: 4Fe-4S dicluster domain-containing protein [Phaeodactylibacter sp.]|nr:4Fe-4S dicluster domain-containing protein [Phaeodactylibacter sp.]MCB9274996.1 4Fe-4S dicluster domain-containing protein [Lewinellaceae bacterium]